MKFTRWAFAALALGFSAAIAAPSGAKPGEPGARGDGKGDHHRRDRGEDDRRTDARDNDDKENDEKDRDKDKDGKRKGDHGRADDDRDAGRGKDKDDDKSDAEPREFGRGLFEQRERAIVDVLNRDHKAMTDDEREAVRRHWRRLARFVRIRELAVTAKEDAFVKRVELDIDREEKAFTVRLEKLHDQAPAAGGAR